MEGKERAKNVKGIAEQIFANWGASQPRSASRARRSQPRESRWFFTLLRWGGGGRRERVDRRCSASWKSGPKRRLWRAGAAEFFFKIPWNGAFHIPSRRGPSSSSPGCSSQVRSHAQTALACSYVHRCTSEILYVINVALFIFALGVYLLLCIHTTTTTFFQRLNTRKIRFHMP